MNDKKKRIVFLISMIFSGSVWGNAHMNIIRIHILSMHYHSTLSVELYSMIQIVGLTLFLSFVLKKYINNLILIGLLSLIYGWYFFLESYFIVTGKPLDFAFLRSGLTDIPFLIQPYLKQLFFVIISAVASTYFILNLAKDVFKKKSWIVASIIFILLILVPQFINDTYSNKLYVFSRGIITRSSVLSHYRNLYEHIIEESQRMKYNVLDQAQMLKEKELPSHLNNIVFIQLESVDSFLVNEQITPVLLEIAHKGFFFPKFYANSVQTILGQENLLCGLPTSFDSTLVERGIDKNVTCLPEILKEAGYETFFMKSFDLRFKKTGEFMNNLQFEHIHSEDIMEENDPKYRWGYREDIFYKRAFKYIQENKSDKRNFIYLEVGPTNHWPFSIPSDFKGGVPFPEPKNHQERFSNTMYIQDHHLKTAWDELNKMFPDGNYTLFILSDHGWPFEMHKGNIFNEWGGYEENFLTPMVLVVGNHKELKEKKIEEKYSLMDVMPTIAELLDISLPKSNYYRSFAHVFSNEQKHEQEKNRTILVQPFSSKILNIIDGDMKYQYNSKKDQLLVYSLLDDPEEGYPNILSQSSKKNIDKISKILPIFENRNIIMHAMGRIDGRTYTNSREAFQEHYNRGRRVFEVDLALTKDEKVVASHSKKLDVTQEEFLSKKIYSIYSTLSLANILDLMVKFPDMILVTDTKDDFPEIISKLVDLARQKDETLLGRVIPQIYSEDSYYNAMRTYPFDHVIYTLYQKDVSDDEVVKFFRKVDNIYAVTMSVSRFSKRSVKKINNAGMRVFVHTLNSQKEIEQFSRNGVDGIYTDYY